jgi:hypothetical protein
MPSQMRCNRRKPSQDGKMVSGGAKDSSVSPKRCRDDFVHEIGASRKKKLSMLEKKHIINFDFLCKKKD